MADQMRYVGLVVPSGWRQMIEGVVRYAYPQHQWRVKWFSGWGGTDLVADAFREKFDGMIVTEDRPGLADAVAAGPWPTVLASDSFGNAAIPAVDVDNDAVGQLAAQYLLNRGFERFVVCGDPSMYFSRLRCRSLVRAITDAGKTAVPFEQKLMESDIAQAALGNLLVGLAKPLAVFCESDWVAKHVADVCHMRSLRVPEDVAILGVGNDELICQLTFPPLSSVMYPVELIGHEAARLLDTLMAGGRRPAAPLLLPPLGITTRASTDILAIDDADLADALQFIREHAAEPISIRSILERVPIGRRTLEKKFRRLLGRSPLEEIQRIRLEKAKLYLAGTEMLIPDVAKQCGFADARRFATVFRQTFHSTPTAYRANSRNAVGPPAMSS
jgi:LacI family transcriptional regulator